jgi:hypothetical protein
MNSRFLGNIRDQPATGQSRKNIGSPAEAAIGVDQLFCGAPLRQRPSIVVTVLKFGFVDSAGHHPAPCFAWPGACDTQSRRLTGEHLPPRP